MLVWVTTGVYFDFVERRQVWLGVTFRASLLESSLHYTKIDCLYILTETERRRDYLTIKCKNKRWTSKLFEYFSSISIIWSMMFVFIPCFIRFNRFRIWVKSGRCSGFSLQQSTIKSEKERKKILSGYFSNEH